MQNPWKKPVAQVRNTIILQNEKDIPTIWGLLL